MKCWCKSIMHTHRNSLESILKGFFKCCSCCQPASLINPQKMYTFSCACCTSIVYLVYLRLGSNALKKISDWDSDPFPLCFLHLCLHFMYAFTITVCEADHEKSIPNTGFISPNVTANNRLHESIICILSIASTSYHFVGFTYNHLWLFLVTQKFK